MAEGFRKAFFGFNCDDVVEYIKKTHSEFSQKQDELNEKIAELHTENSAQRKKITESEAELQAVKAQLEEYKAREEEITKISENIGRLYIVSQANARAVTQSAEENRKLSQQQVEENLAAIKAAHEALESIISGVTDTSVAFTDGMRSLSDELDKTEKIITENNEKADKAHAAAESLLSLS